MYFNFNGVLNNFDFKNLCFGITDIEQQNFKTIQSLIENSNSIYLLSVGVLPSYRCKGIASYMLNWLIKQFKELNIVSDVSNANSLSMYVKNNFSVTKLDKNYYFVQLNRRK